MGRFCTRGFRIHNMHIRTCSNNDRDAVTPCRPTNMTPWDPINNATIHEAPSTRVQVITLAVDLPHTSQTRTTIAFVKKVCLVTYTIEFLSSSMFSNRRPSKSTPQSVIELLDCCPLSDTTHCLRNPPKC